MMEYNLSSMYYKNKRFLGILVLNIISYFLICLWLDGFVDKYSIELSFLSYIPILMAFLPYVFAGSAPAIGAMWSATMWFLLILGLAGRVNDFSIFIYWFMGVWFFLNSLIEVFLIKRKTNRLYKRWQKIPFVGKVIISFAFNFSIPFLLFLIYLDIK